MGEHSPDAGKRSPWTGHDGVMHRMQDLMGEPEGAVAERVLQQIVGGSDRSYEGVLDGEAAGIRLPVAHGCHHVFHVPAGQNLEIGPTAACRSLAEGSLRALDCYAHGALLSRKQKARQTLAGHRWFGWYCAQRAISAPDGHRASPAMVKRNQELFAVNMRSNLEPGV